MNKQTDIESDDGWTVIAALSLVIVYSLVAVAYGYSNLLEIVAEHDWPFARLIAMLGILLCIAPGVVLWKVLRRRSKYAAIYGLLLAAICCTILQVLK